MCESVCVVLPVHFEASEDLLPFFTKDRMDSNRCLVSKNASFNRCQEELAALRSCMCYSHGELAALVCDIINVGRFSFVPHLRYVLRGKYI